MANVALAFAMASQDSPQVIRDSIHGDLFLSPLELDVVNSLEMQRLARLRQLHLVYLVYPGATHSRLSHSLGTLAALNRVLQASEGLVVPDEDLEPLRLAALLHDVAHTCFAHVIEPSFRGHSKDTFLRDHPEVTKDVLSGKFHDAWTQYSGQSAEELKQADYVGNILRDWDKELPNRILNILHGRRPELSSLVSGEIDVDQLDYIARDALHLGMKGVAYDDAIFSGFEHEQGRVVLRDKPIIINAAADVIHARWQLFRHAYLHHAVMGANALLVEAVRKSLSHEARGDCLYVLGDDELLHMIASQDPRIVETSRDAEEDTATASRLATRLLQRKLFKRVYANSVDHVFKNMNFERPVGPTQLESIIRKIGLGALQGFEEKRIPSLVGYPLSPPDKSYDSMRVAGRAEGASSLPTVIRELRLGAFPDNYGHLFKDLDILYFYIDSEDSKAQERAKSACVEHFGPSLAHIAEEVDEVEQATSAITLFLSRLENGSSHEKCMEFIVHLAKSPEGAGTQKLTGRLSVGVSAITGYWNEIDKAQRGIRPPIVKKTRTSRSNWYAIPSKRTRRLIGEATNHG